MTSWTPTALLPFVLTVGVGGGLAWALHRWWDPLPRRATWVAAIVLAALFSPVLIGGRVLLPLETLPTQTPFRTLAVPASAASEVAPPTVNRDALTQLAPWQRVVRASVRAGEWPLWNRHAGAGEPVLGNPRARALEPLHLITRVLPFGVAMGARAALTVWIALLFGFLFLRRWGFDSPVAMAGAAAFAYGAFVQLWLATPAAVVASLLPALAYAVTIARDRRRNRDLALVATMVAWLAVAGHPAGALAVGALASLVLFGRWWTTRTLDPVTRHPLRHMALAALVGCGLSAVVLLPVNAASRQSLGPPDDTGHTAVDGLARLGSSIAPHAWGHDRRGAYWGPTSLESDAAGFVGSAVLLSVLLGLAPARRCPGEWGARIGLVIAAVGLARFSPFVDWLGGESELALSSLWFAACAVFLACCTWQRCRTASPGSGALVVATTIAVLMLSIAYARPAPSVADTAHASAMALRLATFVVQMAVILATALLLTEAVRGRWRSLGLLVVVVPELLLMHANAHVSGPRQLLYPWVPALAFVAENVHDSRMAAIDHAFPPNLASAYGLDDVRSGHPDRPRDVRRLLQPAMAPNRRAIDVVQDPNDPLLQLLGVRYFLARRGAWQPPPLTLVLRRASAWVYESHRALPRLFLPAAAQVTTPAGWRPAVEEITNFAVHAVVTEAPFRPGQQWRAQAPPASTLTIDGIAATHLHATATLVEPRVLASSVYQDGGWRLLINRHRQPSFLANGPLLGAWLPQASQRVDLLYRPPGFLLGLFLTAVAFTAALAWWLPIGRGARPRTSHQNAGRRDRLRPSLEW